MEFDYKLGCIPSIPDKRDFISSAIIPSDTELPLSTNNRSKIKYIRDQGNNGFCVGFGCVADKNIQEFDDNNLPDGGMSPLYIYTLCKQRDGYSGEGTYINTGLDVMREGVLPENLLPYNKNSKRLPTITSEQLEKAKPYRIESYSRVLNLQSLKQSLVAGNPVIAGLMVSDSFRKPEGMFIDKPKGNNYGGHCIIFVDYDDNLEHKYRDGHIEKGFILIQNSWSKNWGNNGMAWISYSSFDTVFDNMPLIYEMWTTTDFKNSSKKLYYRTQVGAFSVKSNCQAFLQKLKQAGFATYMPPLDDDNLYRVQCGCFNSKDRAYALRDKLIQAGFKGAFVVYK